MTKITYPFTINFIHLYPRILGWRVGVGLPKRWRVGVGLSKRWRVGVGLSKRWRVGVGFLLGGISTLHHLENPFLSFALLVFDFLYPLKIKGGGLVFDFWLVLK